MKLDIMQQEWEKDSQIDQANLGHEATKNPQLYSKYLNYLSNTKLLLRKAQTDYLTLRDKKFRYYRGEMSKQELLSLGWNQYQGKVPLKSEMDEFLKMDAQLMKAEDKVEYYEVTKSFLEGVLKALNTRGWEIKSAIEWYKIQNAII